MKTPSTPPSPWRQTTTLRALCWLFSWRTLRRCLLTAAALVTLVALFYAEENWRGARAWDQHRRALEAKGEKSDLASLSPPPLPDEQNLAMTSLLKAIYPFTHDPAAGRDTNTMKRLEWIDETKQGGQRDAELVVGSLERGTFTDLAACAKFYLGNTNYPQPPVGASAARTVQVALSTFDPEFAELRAAAGGRPLCRFPLHYSEEMPLALLLPHLARLKRLTAVAQLRAIAELDLGDSEKALTELTLALRLTEAIREEPLLIDHLVRIAMLAQGDWVWSLP